MKERGLAEMLQSLMDSVQLMKEGKITPKQLQEERCSVALYVRSAELTVRAAELLYYAGEKQMAMARLEAA